MTPARLRECVDLIGWSMRGLADRLGCDNRLVRRWASGAAAIPESVSAWLERLAEAHSSAPAPQDWRQRPVQAA